jgi:predicted DCC family thiol-disulfide oxidoreductase YuxK
VADHSPGKKILLFDGVCNLCNSAVRFVLRHDRKDQFLFASLQGPSGQHWLSHWNLPLDNYHSFVLIDGDHLYTRSSALLQLFRLLGNGWQLFYPLIWLPRPLRDSLYNLVARNRYRWFGKKESCMVPEQPWQEKFLD